MKNILAAITALFVTFSAQAADAQRALQQFVDGVQSLQAEFTQEQRDERGKVLQSQSGQMWLSRPGRFRWEYQKPYVQQIICDGQRIWYYEPDLAQVTVRSAAEALNGTPAALLSQRTALLEAFTLESLSEAGGEQTLRLVPKSDESDFRAIELTLEGSKPTRMNFLDQLGGSTELRLHAIQTGVAVDASRFRFTVPKGVEVVDAGAAP